MGRERARGRVYISLLYCAVKADTLAQYLQAIYLNHRIRAEGAVTHLHRFKIPLSVWTSLISGAPSTVLLKSISLCDPTHGSNTGEIFVLSHFTFGVSDIAKSRKASANALTKTTLSYGGAVPFPK